MLLTVQIVNYKSFKHLKGCLGSLKRSGQEAGSLEAIIINNDDQALDSELDLSKLPFSAKTVEVGKNVGFGRAHNLGAKKALGEFLLFLNPDAEISPGGLQKLVNVLQSSEKIGAAGPLLVGTSGNVEEEHCGARKTPLSMICGKVQCRKKQEIRLDSVAEVDWISGGAMLIKKEIFDKAGGFDENYFMYFEDVDLCNRVKKLGYRVMVNSRVKFLHRSGKSFADSRSKKTYYYASQDYYIRKNFGILSALAVKVLRFPIYLKNVYFE